MARLMRVRTFACTYYATLFEIYSDLFFESGHESCSHACQSRHGLSFKEGQVAHHIYILTAEASLRPGPFQSESENPLKGELSMAKLLMFTGFYQRRPGRIKMAKKDFHFKETRSVGHLMWPPSTSKP